ncbi:hypothetical protein Stube_58490 [Streptomyces tubercidicus]|uniref:GH15-like domain-containing protein n=1 Tax=Streptomyces tubercidicus TaxID=47759 RepID=A0A640V4W4_9ACTN|nr:hypothetical protein Stube_58490 [Streptomyces tubercidicus]
MTWRQVRLESARDWYRAAPFEPKTGNSHVRTLPPSPCIRTRTPTRQSRGRGAGHWVVAVAAAEHQGAGTGEGEHIVHVPPGVAEGSLEATEEFWREWVEHCTYRGPYRDAVVRSLITLKALTYAPTPTISLLECLGGVRNWDYRFTWLRDAVTTLSSPLRTGYREEARAWREWLLRAVAGDPENPQIMYGIAGERELGENENIWLRTKRKNADGKVVGGSDGVCYLYFPGQPGPARCRPKTGAGGPGNPLVIGTPRVASMT